MRSPPVRRFHDVLLVAGNALGAVLLLALLDRLRGVRSLETA